MRQNILKLFLLVIGIGASFGAAAQTCNGSLGDPVINETFGAGTNAFSVGAPIGNTSMTNTTSDCPNDGQYAIVPSTGGCFGGTWQTLSQDHTHDPFGYMMLINASFQPSTFYVETVPGNKLCPNTTYQFAAWIVNMIRVEPQTTGYIEPNITFSIETTDGKPLAPPYNTGNIPATDFFEWKQYSTFFTTPSDGSDFVVKLTNNSPGGNGNDLALDDITFSPCGPLIQTGFGTIGDITARQQCAGGSSTYTLVASQTGYDNPSYQWQANLNNGQGWQDIAGATSTTLVQTFKDPAGGTYEYRIGVLGSANTSLNCRIYSAPLTINIYPYPVIGLSLQTAICEGQQLRLESQGGDTYQWTGPNGFTSTDENPDIDIAATPADDGVYTVTVTSNGCPTFASTTVTVYPKVTAVVSNDIAICEGSSTALSAAQSTNALYYKWSPSTGLSGDDQATVVASPAQTTTYSVEVSNGGCVDDNKKVTVTVLKKPVANAGSNKTLREGESVTLDGTAMGDSITYYWTPADHLDNPNSLTPLASPDDNTTYTLHVASKLSCGESTSSVFVRVFKKITIPNTFTPNSDGINDFWDIKQLDTYPDCQVSVFNRYGQKVFESTGYPKPWNGSSNNTQLPADTYYYIIDLKNNFPKIAGWVLIVR